MGEKGEKELAWIRKAVTGEFENFQDHPEYISFLRAKFDFLPR
jgi:hypothetical protein